MTEPIASLWGANQRPLLSLDEAWESIAREVQPLAHETARLDEAHGRTLAAPVTATDDYPPFDKAMMDGFAVRAEDCSTPDTTLRVIGSAPAGGVFDSPVQSGEAVRINTGAPVPNGADAVVRIEDTSLSSDGASVRILVTTHPYRNITRAGTHARRGDFILAPPMLLEAPQIGVLAANGYTKIEVFPTIRVAIAPTGDELVQPGMARGPGLIHESNGWMLSALMRQFGATPHHVGIIRDNEDELREKLSKALAHPVLIAVGGMSMGTLDLVPKVFAKLGVEWRFHGVNMRPGKPVAYGRGPAGQHVFGLPGNPVSAYVCSWLFVRMAVRGLAGHAVRPPHTWRATLTRPLKPSKDGRPAFLPARVWNDAGQGMVVEPCGWGGSGDPFGAALANALIVRREPAVAVDAGGPADVILISSEL